MKKGGGRVDSKQGQRFGAGKKDAWGEKVSTYIGDGGGLVIPCRKKSQGG